MADAQQPARPPLLLNQEPACFQTFSPPPPRPQSLWTEACWVNTIFAESLTDQLTANVYAGRAPRGPEEPRTACGRLHICGSPSAKRRDSLTIWVICLGGRGCISARVSEDLAAALSSGITLTQETAPTAGPAPPATLHQNSAEPQTGAAPFLPGSSFSPPRFCSHVLGRAEQKE